MKVFLSLISVFCFSIVVICQNTTTTSDSNLPSEWSYCFEFTWVGPAYDNNNRFNRTCEDYLDETRATNVPCSAPIVISEDGTLPDIDYLFDHHRTSVLCKRTPSQVCASYTYKFGGAITNATYMCTKVQEVGKGAIKGPSCYSQTVDGYEVELCVCESNKGPYKPCNGKFNY